MNTSELFSMTLLEKEFSLHNHLFILTNQRVIFWPKENTLILSDLHVGKAAHFRKSGIAIPSEVLMDDLQKLEDLILHYNAQKIVIVGDLFHAGYNSDLDLFKDWRAKFSEEFILITGNHDRLSCNVYEELGIECLKDLLIIDEINFVHDPKNSPKDCFCISGHIHPGFVLRTRNESIKLPCYAVSDHQIVLPAFSKFTGLDTKSLKNGYRNIVFTEGTIFEV